LGKNSRCIFRVCILIINSFSICFGGVGLRVVISSLGKWNFWRRFFQNLFESLATFEVGCVIQRAKGAFCRAVPIFGTFISMMICTAFDAARDMITIVLRVTV